MKAITADWVAGNTIAFGYALIAVTAAAPFLPVDHPPLAAEGGGFSRVSRFAVTAVIAVTAAMKRSAMRQR